MAGEITKPDVTTQTATNTAVQQPQTADIKLESSTFATFLVIGVAFAIVVALLIIFSRLKAAASAWSISDALSEETEAPVPVLENGVPIKDPAGNIVTAISMKASSSRLIALLGLVALLLLYIGVGLTILFSFAQTRGVPGDLDKVNNFFLYGLVMFAPYIVNKFASVFNWLK